MDLDHYASFAQPLVHETAPSGLFLSKSTVSLLTILLLESAEASNGSFQKTVHCDQGSSTCKGHGDLVACLSEYAHSVGHRHFILLCRKVRYHTLNSTLADLYKPVEAALCVWA